VDTFCFALVKRLNFTPRFLLLVTIRPLLRLLILLLGIFYLDTVCQTDAEDARAYYARGIIEYVATPASVALMASATRPAARVRSPHQPAADQLAARWQQQLTARATPYPLAPPALRRRWLRCGVLQV
jgi:hypothetical protein